MGQMEKGVYVRVPQIGENPKEARDFLCGQILETDEVLNQAVVRIHDPFDYGKFYGGLFQKKMTASLSGMERCALYEGTKVMLKGGLIFEQFTILALLKTGAVYSYLLQSDLTGTLREVPETEIIAPFNNGKVDPALQLKTYEFQNPVWFQKRTIVQKRMNYLENLMYGFKDVAGAKINLLPHQMKVIMRCLSEQPMRYMLADEVGMGKTIEALAILRSFLHTRRRQHVLIVTPDALKEQWRMEMLLKFGMESGRDENQNYIDLVSMSEFLNMGLDQEYQLLIVDEVHELIKNSKVYNRLVYFSNRCPNVLFLSATPVRHLKQDYLKLLQLLDPAAFSKVDLSMFEQILAKQNSIMDEVLAADNSLKEMQDSLEDDDEELLEEYFEEIQEALETVETITDDENLKKLLETIDFSQEDHGIKAIKRTIAYLAETYQVEKNILKNRRKQLEKEDEDGIRLAKRHLIELPYATNPHQNALEYEAGSQLMNWINEQDLSSDQALEAVMHLLQMFFSSSWAYLRALENNRDFLQIPEPMIALARRWTKWDDKMIDRLPAIQQSPWDFHEYTESRLYKTIDFLDQELGKEKAVVFVSDPATFAFYKKALCAVFPEEQLAYFDSTQKIASLEENSFRFQNDPQCRILLSDPTGGEGRNFQNANYIVHVDLPWDAGKIEQRIGRLDRLERDQNHLDVYSVVLYTKDTIEEGLASFWKNGLQIFTNSLSGLEIVMGMIQSRLSEVIREDLRMGMVDVFSGMNDLTKKLIREVRREQNFDILSDSYSDFNNDLEKELNNYLNQEDSVYADALLSWASIAGFRGHRVEDKYLMFSKHSFSLNSARRALLIPPEWKHYMSKPENQYLQEVLSHFTENPTHSIKGTFLRKEAVQNDFVHFFAPGDEVFDSITDNAIHSARGQCAAIRLHANFSWKGFVMVWKAVPDTRKLLKEGIPVSILSQYRHFMCTELISVPYTLSNPDGLGYAELLDVYQRWIKAGSKDNTEHLGQRSASLRQIHGEMVRISNIELFKMNNPSRQWRSEIDEAVARTKEMAKAVIRRRQRVAAAESELERRLNSQFARSLHYGLKFDLERQEKQNQEILQILRDPEIVLDSVIYIEVEEV